MELTLLLIIGIVVIITAIVMYAKLSNLQPQQNIEQLGQLQTELALANQSLLNEKSKNQQIAQDLAKARQEVELARSKEHELINKEINLTGECARLNSENSSLKSGYDNLQQIMTELKSELTKEFTQIKTQALLELQNKANESLANIGKTSLMDPLTQKFRELDERILELRKETHDVSNKSSALSEQANNLTQALIRDSQKKGEFGEMILANILEFAGLSNRVDYIEQTHINTVDSAASNLRPDCIVNLPDGRGVVIDSKNITGEYYKSINEGVDKTKAIRDAIFNTIKNLASKNYVNEVERIFQRNIFDYTIMFIPNEGLFSQIVELDAKQDERGILWFAYQQKIIIAGPSTILPLLAMIDKMWQNHQVEEKSAKIIQTATQMMDQLRLTLEKMTKLGRSINQVGNNYDDVIKSFANGTAGSFVGKFSLLSGYNREIDQSQPLLGAEMIKKLPVIEV